MRLRGRDVNTSSEEVQRIAPGCACLDRRDGGGAARRDPGLHGRQLQAGDALDPGREAGHALEAEARALRGLQLQRLRQALRRCLDLPGKAARLSSLQASGGLRCASAYKCAYDSNLALLSEGV